MRDETDYTYAIERVRECDCPEYVSRCAHDGELRVWWITGAAGLAEYERRTGIQHATSCVGCGYQFRYSRGEATEHPGAIYGPGYFTAGPQCACTHELYAQVMADVLSSWDELESVFAHHVALMHELADELAVTK